MMLNYTNILLFYLSLNILSSSSEVYNQRNHFITYTPKRSTRLLCECELYTSIFDNDPEMKSLIEHFNKQTQQRFHEYDERMKTTRQKCREQCDKEIQKIILKDKLEKELAEKFVTLQTDIQSDAIPTCICEKSLADKVEKTCLKCGGVLGGGVTPAWGFLSGIVYTGWKAAALAAATKEAIAEGAAKGAAAGTKAGIKAVMDVLYSDFGLSIEGVQKMGLVLSATNYKDVPMITKALYSKFQVSSCLRGGPVPGVPPVRPTDGTFCSAMLEKILAQENVVKQNSLEGSIKSVVNQIVTEAKSAAVSETAKVTASETETLKATNIAAVNATYASSQTAIIASIIAIVVIILIMVIIYLILRYRRKKKMKKKLQYIKLLEE
ncbi:rifin [Plasmodium falciparum NF54]|uniref:Rifin n=2 Tax=Plasmodium falciparum TaxID=5833 RepID=Q8I4P3_PLAF7|nr:rifin [Plasmodium falciparum 3D7]EWC87282.1 hypothetical protein PFNF54_04059 [Plasmodium falciparum NF54]KAF4326961.1 rifin [Plasmodium falciparum NF54]PKC48385.1 rifin [Plasmodium falciparum NF54]CZT99697.1 rifin [Plasmodium falciparum 3D7]|eukprot:XP_001350927.1 rifin [Plasmodium falciparum 3D7]